MKDDIDTVSVQIQSRLLYVKFDQPLYLNASQKAQELFVHEEV